MKNYQLLSRTRQSTDESLQAIAARLEPGTSRVIVLFETVWEQRFRAVARKYGGEISEQRLVSSATVAQAARNLLAK